MRATQHSGRMGSAKHNDRTFDLGKATHIDSSRMADNVYYSVYENMTFQQAEKLFYERHFDGMIADINERAEKSRHPERKTNPEKLLKSQKTKPEEVIFQIGNKDTAGNITGEQLMTVFNDFLKWHEERFGEHVKTLNAALHMDEKTPHIHVRRVWVYEHEKGFSAIGQHKALEQMGFTLPDETKKRDRHNNLKQVYTAECREKWLDCCIARGIEVERTPEHRPATEQNLKKNDYILQKQEQALQDMSVELGVKRELLKSAMNHLDVLKGEICILTSAEVKTMGEDVKTSRIDKNKVLVPKETFEKLLITAGGAEMAIKENRKLNNERQEVLEDARQQAKEIKEQAKQDTFSERMKNAKRDAKLKKYERLEKAFPSEFQQMEKALKEQIKTQDITHHR